MRQGKASIACLGLEVHLVCEQGQRQVDLCVHVGGQVLRQRVGMAVHRPGGRGKTGQTEGQDKQGGPTTRARGDLQVRFGVLAQVQQEVGDSLVLDDCHVEERKAQHTREGLCRGKRCK